MNEESDPGSNRTSNKEQSQETDPGSNREPNKWTSQNES